MKLVAQTLFEKERQIVDADISEHMIVMLLNRKGEHVVSVDDVGMFTVSPDMHMLRMIASELVLYDGQDWVFTMTSQRAFAEQHGLQYDICVVKVKRMNSY